MDSYLNKELFTSDCFWKSNSKLLKFLYGVMDWADCLFLSYLLGILKFQNRYSLELSFLKLEEIRSSDLVLRCRVLSISSFIFAICSLSWLFWYFYFRSWDQSRFLFYFMLAYYKNTNILLKNIDNQFLIVIIDS